LPALLVQQLLMMIQLRLLLVLPIVEAIVRVSWALFKVKV